MEHRDGTKEGSPLIDTRQVMYVALAAVCRAYLDGQLTAEDVNLMNVELTYNSHKLRDEFGHHPVFVLSCEIDAGLGHMSACEHYSEQNFREDLRKVLGVGMVASNNTIVVEAAWNLPAATSADKSLE